MAKKVFKKVNIDIYTQGEEQFTESKCYAGVISKCSGTFRFEEAVRKGRNQRNPKLFDGKYVSLIRKGNGKYQICSKLIEVDEKTDVTMLDLDIWADISNALQIVIDHR